MRTFILYSLIALLVPTASLAAGAGVELKKEKWSFDGAFGHFDKPSIQRGFQVYKEVCSSCHALKRVYYRNLQDVGFSEAEVKAIAAEEQITDGPNDDGDMFERPGRASDPFKSPYPNSKAAMASNGGAYPVDLSLIYKARPDGGNYLYSLLTGYSETPPSDFKLQEGLYYNPYFPGGQLAMPTPLVNGAVEYQDGTEATVEQMSRDVTNFLQWASEPEMEDRKRTGIKVLIFLSIFTVLFYLAKVRIWSKIQDEN